MKTELWAMFVPGPDDIWPMPNKYEAEKAVLEHNEWIDKTEWKSDYGQIVFHAKVIKWPYGEKEHKEQLLYMESMKNETF